MKIRRLAMLLSFGLCLTLRAATTSNLIRNGDAEASTGSATCASSPAIPQWTTDGSMSICAYGTAADWPLFTPGPSNRGNNFFNGAYVAIATISQAIDLSAYATDIATGGQAFTLRGWLGGWASQNDNALLKVTFRSATNAVLGTAQIGPVLADERGSATSLVQKTQTGALPAGTRNVLIELTITRTSGSANDGGADNLEFFLSGAAAVTPELVGWWKLNDGSGSTVSDSSGLANHGRISGTATWTTGSNGGALSLDGASHVEGTGQGTQFPRGSAARTIMAWVKMGPPASDVSILHYGDANPAGNLHLYIGANGKPGFGNGDRYGTIAAANTVTDNVWHHVAGVYEGPAANAAKIYVDGVLQGSGAITITPNTGTSLGWRIGSFLLGAGKIRAVVDEVRLYTRALSVDEVRTVGLSTGAFPPACSYTVSPTSLSAPLGGATLDITVDTSSACGWTATSSVSWITFAGASSGTGKATVRIQVAANAAPTQRTGTVTIAGIVVNVTQAANNCEFQVRGNWTAIPGEGVSEASIAVTASSPGCTWSMSSSAAWITILRIASQNAPQANAAPFTGSGSGTAFIRVDANPGQVRRAGAIQMNLAGTVGAYMVQQDPLACSLTLDRYRDEGLKPEGGELKAISVRMSHPLCSWVADTLDAGVVGISPLSGTGSGTLTYTTKRNPLGTPAHAAINFCSSTYAQLNGGCRNSYEKQFEIFQDANCTYSISPDHVDDVPAAGADGSVGVSTSFNTCAVTATSNAAWIQIQPPYPPPNQSWGATLNYRVGANTSTTARSGTISVSKQGLTFRVAQKGAACQFWFLYDSLDIPTAAFSSQLEVQTNGQECTWTARVGSDSTSWLRITSNASGTGKALISFSADENKGQDGRTGTIIVGSFGFQLRQAGTGSTGGQTGGNSGKVAVDQTCNIYGAGHKTPPASAKGGPGILPVEVKLPADSAGKVFVVTKATPGTGAGSPNGLLHDDYYILFEETGGLSAIKSKAHYFLTGVFLDDSEPAGAAPPMLVFRPQVPYFEVLRPQVRQVFYLGDGQNEDKNREFVIPAGATRLFLGTTAGYSDDVVCCFEKAGASWTVEYEVKEGGPRPMFETVAVEFCYNIYGAGHQQTPTHKEGRNTGDLPVEVKLPADAPGKPLQVTRAVPGKAGWSLPEGFQHGGYTVVFKEAAGIAGIGGYAHGFLTGVFLDDSEPSPPAPEKLPDFGPALPDFTTLAPSLRQPFYIGDGQIGGKPREFTVPAGATRLFLGTEAGYSNDIASSFDPPGPYWLVDMTVKGSAGSTDIGGCAYTLSPSAASVSARGGVATFTVNPSKPDCAVAFKASQDWVRIEGVSGAASGPVTMTYRVDANSGAARSGSIEVSTGVALAISQSAGLAP